METLRLNGVILESIVDGPGIRAAIFTQGCPHACPGCHNPDTHDFSGGYPANPETLLAEIRRNPLIKGITLTGGEPFAQAKALLPFAAAAKESGLHLMAYTGYTFEELLSGNSPDNNWLPLLKLLQLLVDGRFVLAKRSLSLRFRGSANQRILDVPASLKAGKAVLSSFHQPHSAFH